MDVFLCCVCPCAFLLVLMVGVWAAVRYGFVKGQTLTQAPPVGRDEPPDFDDTPPLLVASHMRLDTVQQNEIARRERAVWTDYFGDEPDSLTRGIN
jgi:hypothetical protein